MSRRVAIVRTDVSEQYAASIIRVEWLSEIGTTLAVGSHRASHRRRRHASGEICLPRGLVALRPWPEDKYWSLSYSYLCNRAPIDPDASLLRVQGDTNEPFQIITASEILMNHKLFRLG
jgi:hypothetical protein